MRAKTKHGWRRAAGCGLTTFVAALALSVVDVKAEDVKAEDEAPQIVSFGPQGYTLDAAQTNVVQVLIEVGQHAGFTVEAPDNFNSPLTMNLQDVPLDQLLRRVLRNENYIIVYRGGVQKAAISGDSIDKIFLLSPAPGQGGGAVAAPGGSPLAGPAGPGQRKGPLARNPAPPPPPPPGVPADADMAARSALARARAEAHRKGIDMPAMPGPQGVPGAPGAMPGAARMVQNAEEGAPAEEPESPGHGAAEVPAIDVPPNDDGAVPDEY